MSYALVDIGNTAIKAKVYRDNQEIISCKISSDDRSLRLFFRILNIDYFIISSVVPSLNIKIKKINATSTIFLTHDHFSELTVHVEPSTSVGIDRLVNAIAVKHRWDANAVIVDIGTVVTFCRVKKSGQYLGGIIVPGFQMIQNALFYGAEQLPLVDFPNEKPNLIGTSTQAAMASGLFYGAIKMINGIQKEIRKSAPHISTILTGGVPTALLTFIEHDIYDRDLQFEGLKIMHSKLSEKMGLSK